MKTRTRGSWIWVAFATLLFSSCGYQIGATKPVEMDGVEAIFVEVPDNRTQYPRLESKLGNHLADAVIQDSMYRLTSRAQADAVLKSKISQVSYSKVRSSITDGLSPEELRMMVTVNWQVVSRVDGHVLMQGVDREDSQFFLDGSRLTTARDNAFPDALSRVSRKVVSHLSSAF